MYVLDGSIPEFQCHLGKDGQGDLRHVLQLGWAAAVCEPQLSRVELPVCDWTRTEVESSEGVDVQKMKK